MKVMMQRLNQVKYALTKEQEEALRKKGFQTVEPGQKVQKPEQDTAEIEKEAPEPERKEEEKSKGRRAKGEKDG